MDTDIILNLWNNDNCNYQIHNIFPTHRPTFINMNDLVGKCKGIHVRLVITYL